MSHVCRPALILRSGLGIVMLLAACAEPVDPSGPASARWTKIKDEIRRKFPLVQHVGTERVRQLLRTDGLQLLDVRRADEFAVSHLEGAVSIPLDGTLEKRMSDLDRDRPVLVYCSVGYRSAMAAERLRKAGFKNVSNYLGSIFAWHNRGLPVYDAAGVTRRVHPYDASWGELLRR
jgi:rhodanese-related sulfurtransferase